MRWLSLLTLSLTLGACRADAPARVEAHAGAPAGSAPAPGPWSLMRFLGGPPSTGQITDTLRLDPATTGRRVRVDRSRAGASADRTCEADAPDDAAWASLVAALADADVEAALAHPDHMPGLVLDAGYFRCTRAGVQVAVSDFPVNDAKAPRETAALRRLATAYQRVTAEVTLLAACDSLRGP